MSLKEKTASLGGIVFCVVLFVGALVGEYFTVRIFLEAQAAKTWPTTTGLIKHSAVDSRFAGKTKYSVNILYTYEVKGRSYESNRVRSRGVSPKSSLDAETVVKNFPAGAKVTVYYQPDDHSQSYLEVGPDFLNYVIIISPLAIAGFIGWTFIGDKLKRIPPRSTSKNPLIS